MSSALYISDRHQPLSNTPWNEDVARAAIRDIVSDTEVKFDEQSFWPSHPDDDWSDGQHMLSLFWGASANLWTLLQLQRSGFVQLNRDYEKYIPAVFDAYLKAPDTGKSRVVAPGLLFGTLGYQLLQFRYSEKPVAKQELIDSISKTITQPELEMMWGAPGAVLACEWLSAWTNDPVWSELKLQAFEHLFGHMKINDAYETYVWTQDLYGERRQYMGAVHGASGNYQALLKCSELLKPEIQKTVHERALEFLRKTAKSERVCSNWPTSVDSDTRSYYVQWCHGAVGILTSLIDPLFTSEKELFIKAGNLVWEAGPLAKPFGLCHGTAGNGYAFLKLFEHTGDELWLERAKAFAMHAIQQSNDAFKKHGRRRYALLTGDLGLAFYLQACITKNSNWPLVDYF